MNISNFYSNPTCSILTTHENFANGMKHVVPYFCNALALIASSTAISLALSKDSTLKTPAKKQEKKITTSNNKIISQIGAAVLLATMAIASRVFWNTIEQGILHTSDYLQCER